LSVQAVRSRTDGGRFVFTDLSILLNMPLPVELMFPKWTCAGIGLVVPFIVGTFEEMGVWFALLGL